jgi:hypothetical protein
LLQGIFLRSGLIRWWGACFMMMEMINSAFLAICLSMAIWTEPFNLKRFRIIFVMALYERYYWFLEIVANPICCGRFFSLPTFDILRDVQISN